MKTMKLMANVAKGLMLAAFIAVGTTTVNAQEETITYTPANANDWWEGEEVKGNDQVYIYNVGAGVFVTNNTPSEKSIDNATLWTISDSYKFTTADNGIYLKNPAAGCTAGVGKTSDATAFNLKESNNTKDRGHAYKLYVSYWLWGTKNKLFNIDNSSNKYTGANSEGSWNDFLFISADQKEAYSTYTTLYNEANEYTENEKVSTNLLSKLKDILTSASKGNFNTYSQDKASLKDIIDEIKDFLDNTPTGIETIKPATNNVKAEAIYNVNGVRQNNLTKGINIVKMNDGTTKKIIKK